MADFQVTGELDLENLDEVANELSQQFKRGGQIGGAQLADALQKAFVKGTGGTKNTAAFRRMFSDLERQVRGLESRFRSLSRLGSRIGVDPGAIQSVNQRLDTTVRSLNEAQRATEGQVVDQDRLNAAIRKGTLARQAATADVAQQQSLLRNLSVQEAGANRLKIAQIRAASQAARSAASQEIVAQQTSSARAVAATRTASQQRVAIIRAAVRQIEALERGLSAVFRGTANAISAAFRGIGSSIQGAIGRARSQTGALNRAFTQNFSSTLSRRESLLRGSFSRQERILSSSVSRQSAQVARFERVLSGGVLGAATGRSAAATGLGLGGIGAAIGGGALGLNLLTSGFARFSEIERLNKQFLALTGSQERSVALMAQVRDFAKTTSFDLVGVADLAKGFLAIGTASEDVLPRVRTIADAVALTGGGVDELNRIQRAIGQVVSTGKLQGDELNQLAENLPGLNIRKILADQLTGGDTAAIVEMQEAGELTADVFLNALLAGLSGDPRLEGAAEDIAKTLGGRFANLKESFADLGATLIGLVSNQLRGAFAILTTAFASLSQFITGEGLSEGLDTLRTAAGGAAQALGLLLVAKLAAEAFGLLGVALRGLLTPMGIVLAIVAAVGAAFAVLRDASPRFAAALAQTGRILGLAFSAIGDFLGSLGEGIGEALGTGTDLVGTFGDFLAEKLRQLNSLILPFIKETLPAALATAASFIKDTLFPIIATGFSAVVDFITGTAIPAFRSFISFMVDTVVPAIVDKVSGAFEFFRDVVGSALEFVGPLLAPLADGFKRLVDAAKGLAEIDPGRGIFALIGVLGAAVAGFAVGGPIGAAVAGAGAAIGALFVTGLNDEVGALLGDLGGIVLNGLSNLASLVTGALSSLFSIENLVGLSLGFLDLVQRIGQILGTIASDPRLVTALASLATLALAAGVRFVQGLILGISSNLPGLFSLLKSAFAEGGRAALTALGEVFTNFDVFSKVIPAILVGGALLGAWRRAGTQAGTAASSGFLGSFRANAFGGAFAGGGGITRGGAGGAFFESLLFGQGGIERNAARVAQRATDAMNRQLRTLLSAGRTVDFAGAGSPAAAVQRSFDQLVSDIGPSGVTGLRVRNALRNLFRGNFAALAADAGGFVNLGRQIGRNIVTGLAGAFAGFTIGKSIAESGGSGIDAFLGVGGTALALGAIAPPAGIAAAALGTLGVAFGQAGNKARVAAEQTREYTSALEGVTGAAQSTAAATGVVIENLRKENERTRDFFLEAGFQADDFAERVITGTSAIDDELANLFDGFGKAGRALGDLVQRENITNTQDLLLLFQENSTAADLFGESLGRAGFNIEDIGEAIDFFKDESGELSRALEEIADARAFTALAEDATQAKGVIGGMFDSIKAEIFGRDFLGIRQGFLDIFEGPSLLGGLATSIFDTPVKSLQDIATEAANAKQALQDLFGQSYGRSLQSALDSLVLGFQTLPEKLAGLNLDTSIGQIGFRQTVGGVVDGFLSAISAGISEGTITAVPQIQANADIIIDQLEQQLSVDGLTQAEIDFIANVRLGIGEVVNSEQVATAIAAAFPAPTDLPPVEVTAPVEVTPSVTISGGVFDLKGAIFGAITGSGTRGGGLMDRSAGGSFGQSRGIITGASTAIDVPVTVNPIITVGNIPQISSVGLSVVVALAAAINAGVGFVTAAIARVIGAIAGGAKTARDAGAAVGQAAAAGVAAGTATAVSAGVQLAVRFAAGIRQGTGAAVGAARALGSAASSAVSTSTGAAFSAGLNLGNALASGIRASTGAAVGAARALASAVAAASRAALRIGSPSRVFFDIGSDVAEGFKEGLLDNADSMVNAAERAIERVIDRTKELIGANQGILAAGIFENLQLGSGAASGVGFLQNFANLSQIGTDFADVIAERAVELWNATVANNEGTATPSQRAIVGNDFTSLNIFTAAGAKNVAAFLDAGERIVEFGGSALRAGRSLDEVDGQMRHFRNVLIQSTQQLGLDQNVVHSLIDQLGLSDAALDQFRHQVRQAEEGVQRGIVLAEQERRAREAAAEAEKHAEENAKREEEQRKLMLELLRIASIQRAPLIGEVHLPFADPEAVGLALANRVAAKLSP